MTFKDVEKIIAKLPGVTVGLKWGHRTWMAAERGFAWHRPLGKTDIERFGDAAPPQGEILAVRMESLDAKDALLAMKLPGFFTIEHFNGYPGLLIELRKAKAKDVRSAIHHAFEAAAARQKPRRRRA